MFSTPLAVEVLRNLRPASAVTTPDGVGVVMVQTRDKVTVLGFDRVVRVYGRYQVEDVAVVGDYTEIVRAFFRKPAVTL